MRAPFAPFRLNLFQAMTIPAKYENGVFRPLEAVKIEEGTVVEVYVPAEQNPWASDALSKIFLSSACGRTAMISATASST
jgi:predicted DNA-binding antitoxin AbrB/MazE fold protein